MSLQLPFDFSLHAPPHSFDNFILGDNQMVYYLVQQIIHRQAEETNSIYVWGEPSTGKSHLLEAACQQVTEEGGTPAYLPLLQMVNFPADVLEGLESMDLVCLDDVQGVAGDAEWERGLFSLFNRLRETATPLLVSGCRPPAQLGLRLEDLSSRLSWGGVFMLQALDDNNKRRALCQYAEELGLDMKSDVADYLLKHGSGQLSQLIDWLDLVDYASLATKRKVSVTFVRSLLDGSLEYPER